ncbi:MAG: hypothetical protein IPP14_13070 [Planctomycetes bacterium]|nr:hypothetical protein [Planctomycetota bacterium]
MDGFDEEIERLAHEGIGAAIEVNKHMRTGHPGASYGSAQAIQMDDRNTPYQRESRNAIVYKDQVVGEDRLDS